MPILEFNHIFSFTLLLHLALVILLIIFWRKLRREQQRHIRLVNESTEQLNNLLKRFKFFDREIINLVEEKISHTLDGIPSIGEQLGKEGQDRLKKLIDWQEREIKREQELFIKTLGEKTLQSSQDFSKSLANLSSELREIVTAATSKAAEESSRELHNAQKQKMDELAKKTELILNKVSKQVLHKSLDQETQQQLVMQALEEAWEKGVFTDEKH